MREFHFHGGKFEWLTFYDEKNPNVTYGKHSFFISDPKTVAERSTFILPEGYAIKVFKNDDWQGTDIVDATIIQNIFWLNGMAPRVKEILKFNTRTQYNHSVHLVEFIEGERRANIPELERVAQENFITINYGGSNLELKNAQNWIDGKYLDFGGFKIDREAYKAKLIEKINDITHYGHLMGENRNSYQSIDDWGVKGKRDTKYRIDKMKLDQIDFNGKSVIDIGCNLGLMLHYAEAKGATNLTGYDTEANIMVAREYASFRGRYALEYRGQDLSKTPPDQKADIVFYLAMSEYLGFPEWLRDITNEMLIYEGHATTSANAVESILRGLFPKVVPLGVSEDRSVRPLFICYK